MGRIRRGAVLGAALVTVILGVAIAWDVATRPRIPAAERGRRLASREGCFRCHGPDGTRGIPNPGRPVALVPNFEGDVMMYATSREEIREWIRDGVTSRRAKSQSWREERDRGVLVMPAFRDRLSKTEIEDLVAFVEALSRNRPPEDSLPHRGWERAKALGCFGCHGPGGRFAPPNPGSFKGVIPSWNTADFPELVRDRDEFAQWVEKGISDRFSGNRFARFFLERAPVRMPAYRPVLQPGDVDALWAYVTWLRNEAASSPRESEEDR